MPLEVVLGLLVGDRHHHFARLRRVDGQVDRQLVPAFTVTFFQAARPSSRRT